MDLVQGLGSVWRYWGCMRPIDTNGLLHTLHLPHILHLLHTLHLPHILHLPHVMHLLNIPHQHHILHL